MTVDDYLIARNEFEMRGELMAVTKGSPDRLNPAVVIEALERVKQRIADDARAPAERAAEEARAEAESAASKLVAQSAAAEARAGASRQQGQIDARDAFAAGAADVLVRLMSTAVFGVVALGIIAGAQTKWDVPSWLWIVPVGVAALAGAGQLVFGWTVKGLLGGRVQFWIQRRISAFIERWLPTGQSTT